MALIRCPECDREMSDTLDACPHCGYRLTEANVDNPSSTPIGKLKWSFSSCACCIALTAFFIYCAIHSFNASFGNSLYSSSFIVPYPYRYYGFFIMCLASVLFGYFAVLNIIGRRRTVCPYCKKEAQIWRYEQKLKCPYCKKISVRKGDVLETVR